MVNEQQYERLISSPHWTVEKLQEEVQIWEQTEGELAAALDRAVEEEGVDDWEDLSGKWKDTWSDYITAGDNLETYLAAWEWKKSRAANPQSNTKLKTKLLR
jgi:hypothetical protein